SNTHRWSGRLRGRVDALDLTTPRKARGYIGRRAFARPRWRPYRFQMAKLQTPRKARGHIVKRATARHEDPLSRLTRAFFAEITPDAQRDFVALVRCMRIDRVRVLGREAWTSTQLDEHHRRTFTLSVNLLLTTAGCTARAEQVPSLIEALAWCSVFRDLDDDQRKGLNNIPRGLDAEQWARASYTRARLSIERAAAEIAALQEPRARRILGIFQRSIAKFGERAGADAAVRESEEDPFPRRT
ncbi:MAG: hypothetical protein ACXWN1_30065, partial [Thermoanaerobaculia bacterium]